MRDIDNWANSKISILNEQSSKLFNRIDPQKKGVNLKICSMLNFKPSRTTSLDLGSMTWWHR